MSHRPTPERPAYREHPPDPAARRPAASPAQQRPFSPTRPPRPALEEITAQVEALHEQVAHLTNTQLTSEQVTSLVRDIELTLQQQFTRYYSAEIIEAKLAERGQVIGALQEQLADLRQRIETERQAIRQEVSALKAGALRLWERRIVVAWAIFGGGVFAVSLLVQFFRLALHQ